MRGWCIDIGTVGLGEKDTQLWRVIRAVRVEVVEVETVIAVEVGGAVRGWAHRQRDVAWVAEVFGAEWSGGDESEEAESKETIQKGSAPGLLFSYAYG
jgi:hypothetical protein